MKPVLAAIAILFAISAYAADLKVKTVVCTYSPMGTTCEPGAGPRTPDNDDRPKAKRRRN